MFWITIYNRGIQVSISYVFNVMVIAKCELFRQVQRAACIRRAGQFECDGSWPISKKRNVFFDENYRLFGDKRARLSGELV